MSSLEEIPVNKTPAPGWIGGFSTSNPAFAYPDPNLSSLPLLSNMDNIPRLKRQVHVPARTMLAGSGQSSARSRAAIRRRWVA
jgi:hypothetical protein